MTTVKRFQLPAPLQRIPEQRQQRWQALRGEVKQHVAQIMGKERLPKELRRRGPMNPEQKERFRQRTEDFKERRFEKRDALISKENSPRDSFMPREEKPRETFKPNNKSGLMNQQDLKTNHPPAAVEKIKKLELNEGQNNTIPRKISGDKKQNNNELQQKTGKPVGVQTKVPRGPAGGPRRR